MTNTTQHEHKTIFGIRLSALVEIIGGLALLFGLMGLAFYNDLLRLIQ